MMNQRNVPLRHVLLATAIALLGSGCSRENVPPPAAAVQAKPAPVESAKPPVIESPPVSAEALSLLDLKIVKNEAGKSVLKGTVSNLSPQEITYATATFKLYDKKGREIGTSMAGVDHLKAKFSWTFQVEITQEGAVSAKLAGFTAK